MQFPIYQQASYSRPRFSLVLATGVQAARLTTAHLGACIKANEEMMRCRPEVRMGEN